MSNVVYLPKASNETEEEESQDQAPYSPLLKPYEDTVEERPLSLSRQSRRSFPTNKACGWKKPFNKSAVRRPK